MVDTGGPPSRRGPLLPWLLSATLLASPFGGGPFSGRVGLVIASAVTVIAAAYAAVTMRPELARSWRTRPSVWLGATCVAVVAILPAPLAADKHAAAAEGARVLAVLAFGLLSLVAAESHDGRLIFGKAAALAIAFVAGLFFVGLLSNPVRSYAFEHRVHIYVGTWPRFQGVSGNPYACAIALLAWSGLTGYAPDTCYRRFVRATGMGLLISTGSFVALLAPLLCVNSRRALGKVVWAAVIVAALLLLWFRPLSVTFGEHRLSLGGTHPNYTVDNNGPTYMPIRQVRAGPLSVDYHGTVYFYLARRGVLCFVEHPIFGVGGRNFRSQCPVVTMNQDGSWEPGRVSHNQYVGWLAEHGLSGIAAAVILAFALRGRRLPRRKDTVTGRALALYSVAAIAGEAWFQFPFAALLAVRQGTAGNGRDDELGS